MRTPKTLAESWINALKSRKSGELGTLTGHLDAGSNFLIKFFRSAQGADIQYQRLFELFPDLNFQITEEFSSESSWMAFGVVCGSLRGEEKEKFNVPASARLVASHGLIQEFYFIGLEDEFEKIILRHAPFNRSGNAVVGLGGVFFKAQDPEALCRWYNDNLGTRFGSSHSTYFPWQMRTPDTGIGSTSFAIFSHDSGYFNPSQKDLMLNFRVNDLDALLSSLRNNGVQVAGDPEQYDYGKFGWIIDPEGNKIELWQPVDYVLEDWEAEQKS